MLFNLNYLYKTFHGLQAAEVTLLEQPLVHFTITNLLFFNVYSTFVEGGGALNEHFVFSFSN